MNRQQVFEWVFETYGTKPEYMWEKSPEHAVLRNSAGKWYGIIMNVPKSVLKLDGEGNTDVMNVKCDPLLIGSLRLEKGFLPAYHMNKEKWVSILLDGTVDGGRIKELLEMSYDLTMPKKRRV